jgi:hypothetical protein
MTTSSEPKRLGMARRLALVLLGGVFLGLLALTLSDVVPRPVDVIVLLAEPATRTRGARTVILEGERVVAETTAGRAATARERLNYAFWLHPGAHRVELTVNGCPPQVARFDPARNRHVTLRARCGVTAPPAAAP